MQNVQFASPPVTRVLSPPPPVLQGLSPHDDPEEDSPSRHRRDRHRSRSRSSRGDRNSQFIDNYAPAPPPSYFNASSPPRYSMQPYAQPFAPPPHTYSGTANDMYSAGQCQSNDQSYSLPQVYGYVQRTEPWPQQQQPVRQQSMSPDSKYRGRSPYGSEKSAPRRKHHQRRRSYDSDSSDDKYYNDEKRHRSRSRRASHIEYRDEGPRYRDDSPRSAAEEAESERLYRHRRNKTVVGVIGSILAGIFICNH